MLILAQPTVARISAHKTNNLKRQIYTFAAHEGEKFYQCWERFMETSSACPHHGFDTWMLVNHFYDGMSPPMKQLVETMCGGNFLSKHPDEAIDFLNYIAETSKPWMNLVQGRMKDRGTQVTRGSPFIQFLRIH